MSTARTSVTPETIPTGLHAKLVWVRSEIGGVEKSRRNEHLKFEYATESDYYDAVRPLLDAVNVMLYVGDRPPTIDSGFVVVTMDYTYVDADSGDSFTVCSSGMGDLKDAGGVKKARTGAARYHFKNQYLIGDGEDDEAGAGKPAERPARRPAPTDTTQRPAPAPSDRDAEKAKRRREKEMELKELAVKAGVPLRTAIERAGKSKLSDLNDGELTAWISKMRKKADEATAAPAEEPKPKAERVGGEDVRVLNALWAECKLSDLQFEEFESEFHVSAFDMLEAAQMQKALAWIRQRKASK